MGRFDSLVLAFYRRAEPTSPQPAPDGRAVGTDDGVSAAPPLLWNGANAVQADVTGRYYHAVQVSGIELADSLDIEGTLDGTAWEKITGQTGIIANGIRQFTGLFAKLRAVRTAGTGSATRAKLMSRS